MARPFTLKVKGNKPFLPLHGLDDEDLLQKTWRLCHKAADHLEYGSRLENLTWRLWHLRSIAVDDNDREASSSFAGLSHSLAQKMEGDRKVELRDLKAPDFKWTDKKDALRYKAVLRSKRREEKHRSIEMMKQQPQTTPSTSSAWKHRGAETDAVMKTTPSSSASSSSPPSSSSSSLFAPRASSAMEVDASSRKSITPPICTKLADKKLEEIRASGQSKVLDVEKGEGPSSRPADEGYANKKGEDSTQKRKTSEGRGPNPEGIKEKERGFKHEEEKEAQTSATWTIDDVEAAETELKAQGVELSGPLLAMLADLKRGDLARVGAEAEGAVGGSDRKVSSASPATARLRETKRRSPRSTPMEWSAHSKPRPAEQQHPQQQSYTQQDHLDQAHTNINMAAYIGIPHPMQMPPSHAQALMQHSVSSQGTRPTPYVPAQHGRPAITLDSLALAMAHQQQQQQRPRTAGSGPNSPGTPLPFAHHMSPLSQGNMVMSPTHNALQQALSMPSSPARSGGVPYNVQLANSSFGLPKSTSLAEIHPGSSLREGENSSIPIGFAYEDEDGDNVDEDDNHDDGDEDDLKAEKGENQLADSSSRSSKPQCANCGATSTPLWRRDANFALQCNACGLYLKLHKVPRPRSLKQRRADKAKSNGSVVAAKHPSKKNAAGRSKTTDRAKEEEGDDEDLSGDSEGAKSDEWLGIHAGSTCANCGTSTTPLWRKDADGRIICNACGLYYKLHNSHRPVTMRMDAIKRRARYDERRMAASASSASLSRKNSATEDYTTSRDASAAGKQQQPHSRSSTGDFRSQVGGLGSGASTPTQGFLNQGERGLQSGQAAGPSEASMLASMQIPMEMWENQLCPMGAWGEECCQNFPEPGHDHGPNPMLLGNGAATGASAGGRSNSSADVLAAAVAAATMGPGGTGEAPSSLNQAIGGGGAPQGAEMGIIGAFGHNSDWFMNLAQQQQHQHQHMQSNSQEGLSHQQPMLPQNHQLQQPSHHGQPSSVTSTADAVAQAHAQAITFQTAQQFVASLVGTPEEATGPSYPLKRRRVTSISLTRPPPTPTSAQQPMMQGPNYANPLQHLQQQQQQQQQQQSGHMSSPQQQQQAIIQSPQAGNMSSSHHHQSHPHPSLHHHHHHPHNQAHFSLGSTHGSPLVASPSTSTHMNSPSVGSSEWWQELHNEAIASSASSAKNQG